MIVGQGDVRHRTDDHLAIPHHRPILDDVQAEEFLNKPVKIGRLIKLIRNYI